MIMMERGNGRLCGTNPTTPTVAQRIAPDGVVRIHFFKGKGKSGGARVITFVKVVNEKVYLVSIYDKGQLDNLTKDQVIELLKKVGLK